MVGIPEKGRLIEETGILMVVQVGDAQSISNIAKSLVLLAFQNPVSGIAGRSDQNDLTSLFKTQRKDTFQQLRFQRMKALRCIHLVFSPTNDASAGKGT